MIIKLKDVLINFSSNYVALLDYQVASAVPVAAAAVFS